MADSKWFRIVAFLLTTAAFGYLGWLLYDGVQTEFLYLNNDASYTLEAILVMVSVALTILWSIVYHRYIWIGGVACMLICSFIGNAHGEITTIEHVPAFGAMIVLPYLLCAFGILHVPYRSVSTNTPSVIPASTHTPTVSDYPSEEESPSGPFPMSAMDKHTYIQTKFGGEYSYGAIEAIDNDPSLTPSQKEELKIHLRAWGD